MQLSLVAQCLLKFSIYSAIRWLTDPERLSRKILCVDCIRSCSVVWIIMTHVLLRYGNAGLLFFQIVGCLKLLNWKIFAERKNCKQQIGLFHNIFFETLLPLWGSENWSFYLHISRHLVWACLLKPEQDHSRISCFSPLQHPDLRNGGI